MAKRSRKAEVETTDERLTKVCQYYEASAEASTDARQASERDRDYYDNIQWTSAEVATLEKRGQPVITRNRIKPKIDSMLGLERQGRTDPRANPRTPMDDQAANACTDAIRFVCDDNDFSNKRSEVFGNLLIEGNGGAIVEVDERQDVQIRYIPWDRGFADPHSRSPNYSDAKYKGIVVWLDEDEAKAIYGEKAEDVLSHSWAAYDLTQTYDDKPAHLRWIDGKRKRIKVVELYYREAGAWTYCVFAKAGFLVEPQPSGYLDEDGDPECPIEFMSCHVDRENNRYGEVRQLIGPQDEINKRASKALHRNSVNQWMAEAGAIADKQKFRAESAKPDGILEGNPGFKLERVDQGQMTAFELQMLTEAKSEIESIATKAGLTEGGAAESGRALGIRRQAGLSESAGPADALHQWNRAIYIQVWHRIKQFWTAEKWVRVTDDERNIRFVGLNIVDPATGQKQNDVSRMDVDIELDDVPDVATAQQEEFTMMAEAYKANPQTPVNPMGIPFDLVVETSNLRSKQKILDRLHGTGGGMPGQPPMPGQPMGAPGAPPAMETPAQMVQTGSTVTTGPTNALGGNQGSNVLGLRGAPPEAIEQILRTLPQRLDAFLAQNPPPDAIAAAENELSVLLQSAPQARQVIEGAVQFLRQHQGGNASSGLQQSSAGGMAMQAVPPDPAQVIGSLLEQASQHLQQMAQQVGQQMLQAVQQSVQEAVGAIQAAGQQTAQGVQMAGNEAVTGVQQASLEAVSGIQQVASQAAAQVSSNAAAAGITAMLGNMGAPKVVTMPSGRTATIQTVRQ